jgi:hypothetical protein
LSDLDRIVERNFHHLRPRWEDRPGVWRALLLAAESEDFRRMRDFDLYSLQLITGDLWTAGARAPLDQGSEGAYYESNDV